MKVKFFSFFLIFKMATALLAQDCDFNLDRLPIGNPMTRYSYCAVKLNQIFDTNSNQEIAFDQFINKIKDHHIILIGETHTNDQHHQVQFKIIKGLTEAGNSVCLALEMFTPQQNQILDDYISGKISEDVFLLQSNYFNTWGHNYRYYQPIFQYAREHKIKMYGINIKQEYAKKIGRAGIKSLSKEEKRSIPLIDTTNIEHCFFIKSAMQGMDAFSPKQFKNIYEAQCLWDAAMGNGAIRTANENPESNVIVLAGSGHVAYNLGIGRIIKKRSNFSFTSILAVDVADTVKESIMMKVKKSVTAEASKDTTQSHQMPPGMMHGVDSTQPYQIVIRSLADYLFGVKEEERERYPSFGFSIKEKNQQGFEIKRVLPSSIAEEKGLKKGDVILSIDNLQFANKAYLKKYLDLKNWGDEIIFEILRNDNVVNIAFKIEKQISETNK